MDPKARSSAVRLQVVEAVRKAKAPQVPRFTRRQHEVLALLCEGLSNKMICRRLDISAGTAKAHIAVILRELGVASRLQAVVAAHDLGLVDADEAPERDTRQSEPHSMLRLLQSDDANRGPSMAHSGLFAGD